MMVTIFHVIGKGGQKLEIRLSGRNAWALCELIRAGKTGCTTLTHPGPRWSAYVFNLRHKYGLDIVTIHEQHKGNFPGHHARYLLRSKVRIISAELEAA